MPGKVYIGTSGWNYQGWKATFYEGTPRKNWLNFCAARFTGLEVNATFYGLQKKTTFVRWREQTPPEFKFAIKGNRFLTHNKKLNDPEEPIRRERERADGLGNKLAAVVWQLPRNFHKNIDRLASFTMALGSWPETRHVIEFRHASWFDDEVAECLGQYRISACISDASDWPMWDRVTTDLVYLRLHGHTITYASTYGIEQLRPWTERISRWLKKGYDVHVYFDNDAEGAAPYDAMCLLDMMKNRK